MEQQKNSQKGNKISKLISKLSKYHMLVIPIVSTLFAFVFWLYNFLYKANCMTYYGVILNCFVSEIYKIRWFVIIVLILFSFLYVFLTKIFIKNLCLNFDLFFDCVIQGFLLSMTNLLVISFMLSVPLNNALIKWIYLHPIITIIIVIIFSLVLSVFLALIIRMDLIAKKHVNFVKNITIFLILLQVIYFGFFATTYASPNPENITLYTVVTVEKENNENSDIEKYIVIGTYEGDFVCEKIISCNDNINFLNSEDNYDLDNSNIKVKKNEYKIFSSEDIMNFNTVNFNNVKIE